MRVNPTVRWVTREVLEDFEFEGVDARGRHDRAPLQRVRRHRPAGVRTAASTSPPSDRKPHFGFGGGAHHCLGHFVARSDMSEALPLLARRMRDPRPAAGATWLPDSGNTGPIRLPLGFTPGS